MHNNHPRSRCPAHCRLPFFRKFTSFTLFNQLFACLSWIVNTFLSMFFSFFPGKYNFVTCRILAIMYPFADAWFDWLDSNFQQQVFTCSILIWPTFLLGGSASAAVTTALNCKKTGFIRQMSTQGAFVTFQLVTWLID